MQAIRIHGYGDRSVLHCEKVPEPRMLPGDVLIRVTAAAVNPADWQFRRGDYQAFAPLKFPAILGWDVAGIVERVGQEARGFLPGERVYAMCDMTRDGAYAEFVAVNAADVAPAPASLPLTHSAAVPLAALTAWQALFDLANVQSGQAVFVHGAAGSVGAFAVQMAHAAGARVTASASSKNHELLRSLGAERCVDYNESNWRAGLAGFALVLDGAGGTSRSGLWEMLVPGGMLVAIAMPPADPAEALAHGCRGATGQVIPDGQRLRKITALIDSGKLRVLIDSEFPLADVAAAHERSESRHARGKVLLVMNAAEVANDSALSV